MIGLNRVLFFEELRDSQRVLIAGIGGGFDVYCGLPLYLNLHFAGKSVHLANYSFTHLNETDAAHVHPFCRRIDPFVREPEGSYFPEKYLAQWLEKQGLNSTVYAFEGTGTRNLRDSYAQLCEMLNIDTIVLMDGGTDGLMFGDEEELGTPLQDYTSIAAVHQVKVARKYLGTIGFGIDEVSHFRFLENVATLIKKGGYLGTVPLLSTMEEAQRYCCAVAYANSRCSGRESVINNAIASAVLGDFDSLSVARAKDVFVNPLMSLYWFFKLDSVVKETHYYNLIKDLETEEEVLSVLRERLPLVCRMRKTKRLPIL